MTTSLSMCSLYLQTPSKMTPGNYSIKVSGYSDVSLSGLVFTNETELFYENKQVSVFILTSKPFYNRGETGKLA